MPFVNRADADIRPDVPWIVTRIRRCPPARKLYWALDRPVAGQDLEPGQMLDIRGWVLDPIAPVREILLRRCRDRAVLAHAPVDGHRPGVQRAHPAIAHGAKCGFNLGWVFSEAGRYRLEARIHGDDALLPLADLVITDPRAPRRKLLFMHIAKTAGTSVNRFLVDAVGAARCALHVESDPRWRTDAGLEDIRGFDVVSGHIGYPEFDARLDLPEYVCVTVLREPLAHLVSHLAYIRWLAEPSQQRRFAAHPASVQAFAHKLAATDLADPAAMSALIDTLTPEERQLIDNCQTRYLCGARPGDRLTPEHLRTASENLARFDVVGFTEALPAFLATVAERMAWPAPMRIPEENRQPERYGMDAGNAAWARAVEPLVRFDRRLYRFAQERLPKLKARTLRQARRVERDRRTQRGEQGIRGGARYANRVLQPSCRRSLGDE